MSDQHYVDVIEQWDPASEADLPDEVALHLDACESCTAAFDARFQVWEDNAEAVETPAHLMPKTQGQRRFRLIEVALAASLVGVVGIGGVTQLGRNLSTTFNTVADAASRPEGVGEGPIPQDAVWELEIPPNDNGQTPEITVALRNDLDVSQGDLLISMGYVTDDAEKQYDEQLKSVEQDVTALKERVFRTKSSLRLLKELGYIDGDDDENGDRGLINLDAVADAATVVDGRYYRYNANGKDREAAMRWWSDSVSSGEGYRNYGVNGFSFTQSDSLSTFAVDVDTASYTLSRKKLDMGYLPPAASVRVEEFVNYFPYDYIPPQSSPFSVALEGAPTPWNANTWLVRVGVQGKRINYFERKPVHLTFLVDTSGSMRSVDKLDLVRSSLRMLTQELEDGDTVAIVAYAGSSGVVLEPTPMSRKNDILQALNRLQAGGSTAMGSGIDLAYRLADQTYADGAVNRVIIASDGDANVGQTNQESLSNQIKGFAQRGITLTTIGVGSGNYQDTMMEQLANQGDGNYFYIDSEREARRIFVDKLCSTMEVIAKDVKIQVEWNEDLIKGYRLVGYENRDIADKDFRNDAVDAGEIGSGHQVTALYEVVLTDGTGDLATVRIRNKAPGPEAPAVERKYAMPQRLLRDSFDESSADFRIATSAAGFAELLRQSPHIHEMKFSNFAHIARGATRPEYSEDLELVRLLETAARLSGE